MQVRDVMTQDVASVEPTTPVGEAARIMRKRNVGALPVMRGEEIGGIVTDRDIVVRCIATRLDPEITPAEEIMTQEIVFCYDDDDINGAVRAMQARGVQRVLVFDRTNDQLNGIVSIADLAVRADDPTVPAITLHDVMGHRRAA